MTPGCSTSTIFIYHKYQMIPDIVMFLFFSPADTPSKRDCSHELITKVAFWPFMGKTERLAEVRNRRRHAINCDERRQNGAHLPPIWSVLVQLYHFANRQIKSLWLQKLVLTERHAGIFQRGESHRAQIVRLHETIF